MNEIKYVKLSDDGRPEYMYWASQANGQDVEHPDGVSTEDLFSSFAYVSQGWVHIGLQPSEYHRWYPATESWQLDWGRAREAKKFALEAELARRLLSPITLGGITLDADVVAQKNLSDKLQGVRERMRLGVQMDADLLIWRDEANVTHVWPDLESYHDWLSGFTIALEDRGTRMYLASWTHKANIDALVAAEDEEGLLSYDVTVGW